ncbi:MAG: PspC domain-containing protein [Streptosporangiales bacterium]
MAEVAREPRKFYREPDRRVLAGVCRGLATHLGVDTMIMRIAFVLLAVSSLVGVAIYALFWYFVPLAPEATDPRVTPPPKHKRDVGQVGALIAVGVGLVLFLQMVGFGIPGAVFWPLVIVGIGAAILWQQADDAQRVRWREAARVRSKSAVVRTVAGTALVVGGIVGFMTLSSTWDASQLRDGIIFAVVAAVGVVIVAAPFVTKLTHDLSAERRERIRQEERAELAAHVHDSVLQTLTLIQRNAEDTREVQRLARAQERDLRTWLYKPSTDQATKFAAAIQSLAGELEDNHGLSIDVVCVGDCALDERLGAQLQAAREAMVNAAKHSGCDSLSVFAEVEPEQVTVFVRDRGKGYEPQTVPDDRMGVRESIVGRMERNGGRAFIRSGPGEGTEVRLEMERGQH